MSGAVCPACGVAVVPGYVRCPKCHRALPRFSRNSTSPVGGTALTSAKQGPPIGAIVVAVLVIGGLIAYFALRSKSNSAAAAPPPAIAAPVVIESQPAPVTPSVSAPNVSTVVAPTAPHADVIAADLQRTLQRARLWSTVSAIGVRVEVQSSSCRDPQMKPAIDSVAPSFRAAGLTRVRCLEQSGSVAFDREL
jgi:hypothetical protein